MKIVLTHDVQVALCAWATVTGNREFSGLGDISREKTVITVENVYLLGVGSTGYTEFPYQRARALGQNINRKLWFHRHPINGWSSRDEQTATREPLGGIPELVQWSCAIVLTPSGFIGRVDFHVPKTKTIHCPVEPAVFSEEVKQEAQLLITDELKEYAAELLSEFEATHLPSRVYSEFDFEEDDYDHLVSAVYRCGCMVRNIDEDYLPDLCPHHGDEISDWWFSFEPEPEVIKQNTRGLMNKIRDWRGSFNRYWSER